MLKILAFIILLIPNLAFSESKLKVGVLLPLSGEAASYGEQFRKGLEFNPASSQYELIFEDSKFDSKTALNAFYKLTSIDKVGYLISFGGSTCEVLNIQAQKQQLVHIAAGCNTAIFDNQDSVNFRLDVNEFTAAQKTVEYLKQNALTKVALLYVNNSWGGTIINYTRNAIIEAGLSVTADLPFDSTQAGNIRSDLLKIQSSKPDVIFLISLPNLTSLILKQIHQNRIDIPIMSNISVENPEVLKLSGKDAEGIFYLSVKANSQVQEAHRDFHSAFPEANPFVAWGYDSISLITAAKEENSPRKYLQNLKNFIGVFNLYNFDKHGDLHLNYEIREIRDGKYAWKSDL